MWAPPSAIVLSRLRDPKSQLFHSLFWLHLNVAQSLIWQGLRSSTDFTDDVNKVYSNFFNMYICLKRNILKEKLINDS